MNALEERIKVKAPGLRRAITRTKVVAASTNRTGRRLGFNNWDKSDTWGSWDKGADWGNVVKE
jgi:hypothetical protein